MSKTFKNFRGEEKREQYFRSERLASKKKKAEEPPWNSYDEFLDVFLKSRERPHDNDD